MDKSRIEGAAEQGERARFREALVIKRSGGRSMPAVIARLKPYLLGWKASYGMAQTPGIFRQLDEWLRHRLRASSSGSGVAPSIAS